VAVARQPSGPRHWGWHPLRPEWAERLVASTPVRAGDVVVDLGAGEGALTAPLARVGARVLAVELHPVRAERLRRRFAGTRVAVVEIGVDDFGWPGHPFRVVANPPYAGVNALVRDLLRLPQLRSADLVVAERAARGLVRRHPGRVELGPRVPRPAFRHQPPSDARMVRIR
jgi:23S rRNA (adenine-N6)-dimethyltransferase